MSLFKDLLSGIDIKEIKESKVRNTIEHFEEYLDNLNIGLESPKSKVKERHASAAYNMTFSDWQVINPEVYPIRLYIAKEKKLYNFEWSVDIGKIYSESLNIIERLKRLKQFKEEGAGGLLVRFKQ